MQYSHLGGSGLQVSRIGFGNMINFKPEDEEVNTEIIKRCYESGINFFDTAENYEYGHCEAQLGRAIKKLNLPRERIVISTKIIQCSQPGGNAINRTVTLSRKHIIDGMNASLERLQLDYVDIVFAHVFDYDTPISEICRGFNQLIEDGKAFYWGTSNHNAEQIQQLKNYCEQHGLIKPIAEQCQYNMLNRQLVEGDLVSQLEKGYGTTIYSPLCGGLLTGKYNDGNIPQDSRAGQDYGWLTKERSKAVFFGKHFESDKSMNVLQQLGLLAKELGYTQAQLALAWTLVNKDVTTAIIGAKNVDQLTDTLKGLELAKKWNKELDDKVEQILGNCPTQQLDYRKWAPKDKRRQL